MTITGAMSPVFGLMIGLMGAAIGFIAPGFVINNRIRSRRVGDEARGSNTRASSAWALES